MAANRPDHHTVLEAVELANRAPSVHNTQPWRWLLTDTSIHLMADPARRLTVADPAGYDLLLSCGAALHHLRVALAARGWRTTVRRAANRRDPTHLAAVRMSPQLPSDEDLALARAIPHRRTDRRLFSSRPVPEGHLDLMVRRAAAAGALLVPVGDDPTLRRLGRAAEIAARVQPDLPGYDTELACWSGRDRFAEDGVLAASTPNGERFHGRARMRAFSAGTLTHADTGEPDGGRLLVLASPDAEVASVLRAGEAASAALLTATDLGLATCPLSQPLEVPGTRELIREQVLDGAVEPLLIVRTGLLPTAATPVLPSPRRPVEKTIGRLPGSRRPSPDAG